MHMMPISQYDELPPGVKRQKLPHQNTKTYPISGATKGGIFLLVLVCCSSSNTLNKPSPNASAMIVGATLPTIQHEVLSVMPHSRRVA